MMLQIDGSQLEGGGQIIRIAVSCSSIFKIPIHITKIRAGRSKPGLKAQHLTGLQLVTELCDGNLNGGYKDSMEIEFIPGDIKGGKFFADTKTAGSVSLLIQSTLPCALFARQSTSLILRGGTNADMAPPIDYTTEVFRKLCIKFGIHFDLTLNVRGFFPMGKGEVALLIHPLKAPIKAIEMLDQGEILTIKGCSFVAGTLPIKLAHLMADMAETTLKQTFGSGIQISICRLKESSSKAFGNGSSIILWAETSTGCILSSSGLGKRGVSAEEIGTKTAALLIEAISSKSCVDQYSQDQIIMFMALANGKSRVRTTQPTLHTQTAIHIANMLTKAKFNVIDEPETGTVIIECEGINAYVNKP